MVCEVGTITNIRFADTKKLSLVLNVLDNLCLLFQGRLLSSLEGNILSGSLFVKFQIKYRDCTGCIYGMTSGEGWMEMV